MLRPINLECGEDGGYGRVGYCCGDAEKRVKAKPDQNESRE
jgi:hypothetical protein